MYYIVKFGDLQSIDLCQTFLPMNYNFVVYVRRTNFRLSTPRLICPVDHPEASSRHNMRCGVRTKTSRDVTKNLYGVLSTHGELMDLWILLHTLMHVVCCLDVDSGT